MKYNVNSTLSQTFCDTWMPCTSIKLNIYEQKVKFTLCSKFYNFISNFYE